MASNGRGDGAGHRRSGNTGVTGRRAPPGMWTCHKCQNMVRRGTVRCGCGHCPPAHVSAVREPTRRTPAGHEALFRQFMQALAGTTGQPPAHGAPGAPQGRPQPARPRAPWFPQQAAASGPSGGTSGTSPPATADGPDLVGDGTVPPIRAANRKLDDLRRDEKDLAKSLQGCTPLGKAILQERLDDVRAKIKAELGARAELLPGSRQVRIALNHLQHCEDAGTRAEKKLAAHKAQLERMQNEMGELEAKVAAAKAEVAQARESLAKAEAVVAGEQAAASADMAVDADHTVGDESTRCGPQHQAQALSLDRAEDIMREAMDAFDDNSPDQGFIRWLAQRFQAASRTMQYVPETEDPTPPTQIDPTQDPRSAEHMAQPVA